MTFQAKAFQVIIREEKKKKRRAPNNGRFRLKGSTEAYNRINTTVTFRRLCEGKRSGKTEREAEKK